MCYVGSDVQEGFEPDLDCGGGELSVGIGELTIISYEYELWVMIM